MSNLMEDKLYPVSASKSIEWLKNQIYLLERLPQDVSIDTDGIISLLKETLNKRLDYIIQPLSQYLFNTLKAATYWADFDDKLREHCPLLKYMKNWQTELQTRLSAVEVIGWENFSIGILNSSWKWASEQISDYPSFKNVKKLPWTLEELLQAKDMRKLVDQLFYYAEF